MIKQLSIIGLGLIGGSLAKAIKKTSFAETVLAFDLNQTDLQTALADGVIDNYSCDLATACANANLIILALPPTATLNVLNNIAPYLSNDAVVTDVCSVKVKISDEAQNKLSSHSSYFVPGHPIAGTENSGYAAARDDLFRQRHVILTPDEKTNSSALALVTALWQQLGCQIHLMTAKQHDAYLARTSHLPQLTAYALMNALNGNSNFPHILDFVGTGFKDTTRLSGSDPHLWTEISMLNNQEISAALNELQQQIQSIQDDLASNNTESLLSLLIQAQNMRRKI